jgi:ATP/ADP translocase
MDFLASLPCSYTLYVLGQAKKKNWFSGHVFENQMREAGFLFYFFIFTKIIYPVRTIWFGDHHGPTKHGC